MIYLLMFTTLVFATLAAIEAISIDRLEKRIEDLLEYIEECENE